MEVKISKQDYQLWAQYLCPCLNPYCEPRIYAQCQGKALTYGQHKAMIEADLLEDLTHSQNQLIYVPDP
jgi:hypothetical protein